MSYDSQQSMKVSTRTRYGAEPRNTGGETPPHTVYGAEPRKNALRGGAP